MYKKLAVVSILFIFIDQLVKQVVVSSIELNTYIEVIPDFFYLAHVRNEGGAWSIFSGNIWLLVSAGFAAVVFLYFAFIKGKELKTYECLIYGCLYGGIIGNMIDRIVYGYVIDYLSFDIFGYGFPIFNFADIGIVCAVGFVLIMAIKEEIECKKSKLKKE